MTRFFLVLFVLFNLSLFSQDRLQTDSLRRIVFEEKLHDTIISKSYVNLIKYYKTTNKDSCLIYINRLKAYAKRHQSNLGHYYFHNIRAGNYAYFVNKNDNSAEFIISNLFMSLDYAKKLNDVKLIINANTRLSQEHSRLGNFEKGIFYAEVAIEIAKKNDLWLETAYVYSIIGEAYLYYYKKTDKSISYLLKSDSIYQAHKYTGEDTGYNLSFLGEIYSELGNFEEAEKFQKKALLVFKESNNEYQMNYILGNLASLERKKKNYQKAANILLECISYYHANNYPNKEAGFHLGLSEVYFDDNQLSKAIEHTNISLKLSKEYNNAFLTLLGSLYKSRYKLKAGEYNTSHQLALEANILADKLSSLIDKEESLKLLYQSSEQLKDYKKAYEYAIMHGKIKDSLQKNANLEKVQELETKYQTDKKEQEITLLQSQKTLVEEQKINQRNLLLSGIGLTSIAGLFFFYMYKNRQKTSKKLQELDAFKSKLFANISHEFRTPLTLISGPIEKRLNNTKLKQEDRSEFQMIHRNANRLLRLVNQLLDLSKLESGHLRLKVVHGSLSPLLKSISSSFQHQADQKSIDYKVDIQDLNDIWFDKDVVEKTVINLLSNAFKYTPELGFVCFSASIKEDKMYLYFENETKQLIKEQIDNIFNRFYQADENAEGVGIGLSLVKELVTLSHGTIVVENTSRGTIAFTVVLPILKTQFKPDELIEKVIDTSQFEAKIDLSKIKNINIEEQTINEEQPILLVVDDNQDIRAFIKSAFKNNYQVVEASDGDIGVEMAIELVPDIIISDVMMPKRNGFQLTETLKQDERTCHIPIILLTAKAEDADSFTGFDMGADDYIVKPFKIKGLESRVKNLITSRLKLRERYSQEIILKPKDVAVTNFDLRFFEKIQSILDERLTRSSFSVEEFSKAVDLSRMQLHRKLKALTGLSASEFIRSQRIKLAAELLKNSDANVSEIGYAVGFNDHSYFAKCFKDVYGCSPSEFISNS